MVWICDREPLNTLVRPYIKDPELPRAKERQTAGEINLVVVKLEPCAFDDDKFLGKLHRLAPKFKSIAEAPLKSTAWEQIKKDLMLIIERARAGRNPASKPLGDP